MVFESEMEVKETSDQIQKVLARVEALERAALSSLTGLAALEQRLGTQYHEFASAITGLDNELCRVCQSTGAQVQRTAELDRELRDFQDLMQEEWLMSPKSKAGRQTTLAPGKEGDSSSLTGGDATVVLGMGVGNSLAAPTALENPGGHKHISPRVLPSRADPILGSDLCEDGVSTHRVSPRMAVAIADIDVHACQPAVPDDDLHARLDRLSVISQTTRSLAQDLTPMSVAAPLLSRQSHPRDVEGSCNRPGRPDHTAKSSGIEVDAVVCQVICKQSPSPSATARAQEDELLERLNNLEKLVERLCSTAGQRSVCQSGEVDDLRSRVEAAEKALNAAADKLGFLARLVTARLGPTQGGA